MALSVRINSVKEAIELVKSHEISTDSKFIVIKIKKDKLLWKGEYLRDRCENSYIYVDLLRHFLLVSVFLKFFNEKFYRSDKSFNISL